MIEVMTVTIMRMNLRTLGVLFYIFLSLLISPHTPFLFLWFFLFSESANSFRRLSYFSSDIATLSFSRKTEIMYNLYSMYAYYNKIMQTLLTFIITFLLYSLYCRIILFKYTEDYCESEISCMLPYFHFQFNNYNEVQFYT